MEEIWKDIENYEGLYQISNLGKVRSYPNLSHKDFFILKQWITQCGYTKNSNCPFGRNNPSDDCSEYWFRLLEES